MDERYDVRDTRSINNSSEGKTNNVRDDSLSYQFGIGQDEIDHQISLACQSGNDMAHTIGNVSAIVLQFIVDQFPQGTFNTAMSSTRLAHRQLRHTPKQILQQPYPLCIVNPRVSLSGIDSRLAAGSYATTLWSPTSNRFQGRSEMDLLFFDKKKRIEWRGKLNRTVMFFDFVLSFHSSIEQIRWASYLINKIPTDGGFFDIDTPLEMALPDGFLQETAKYANIPIRDENDSVSDFVDYLNMHSVFPVSYKFSSGKNKDAFYAYYMTTLLCNIQDLSYNSVTKSDNVEKDCPITFTLRCEFNTIGMFDLSVPNPGPLINISPSDSGVIIPIFTDSFNEADFPLAYGWKIQSRPICKMDWGDTEIFIGSGFSKELSMLIDYHLDHKIPVELFMSIKLRENNKLIEDGYYIDWESRKLIFTNINYANTYRLIIAINQLYINDLLATIYNKK